MAKKTTDRTIDYRFNLSIYFSLLKRYTGLVSVLLILIFIIEGLHVLDSFFFKIIVDQGTLFIAGEITRNAFITFLGIVLLFYAIFMAIRSGLKYFHLHTINRLSSHMIVALKRKFFDHLIKLSHSFHTTHKTGSLISRLVRSGSAVERVTDIIAFHFAPLIFQVTVVAAALLFVSWGAALITVATIVSFIVFSIWMLRIQQRYSVLANDAEDDEKAKISDYLTNIDTIKYFGKEKKTMSRFRRTTNFTRKSQLRAWDYFRITDAGQGLILGIGMLLIVFVAVRRLLQGNMTIGDMVFVFSTFVTLVGPLYGFMHGVRGFYQSMADFEVLFQYAKIEQEVKDLPHAKNLKITEGHIRLEDVTFRYGRRRVFFGLTLDIPAKKKIALVGHSGCGKTTLVKLLYRLYDVEKGQITIDGQDIRNFKQEALRSEMSIVPQDCMLFDDTIYNNIAFANPRVKRRDVLRAIRFAQLDGIIAKMPDREHTIVGERGVRLSGGEKQRVSIARALLADKKVLVLDEATSALDSQTEHEIQQDLEKLMRGRTAIIIAHRLSTIMQADRIVVFEKGNIVQEGAHAELIKQKGPYKRLWGLQKGGYIR
jgi:ATP-binding cassette subfamily B protein